MLPRGETISSFNFNCEEAAAEAAEDILLSSAGQQMIQRVDLTLDMETDQGDDYMHLPRTFLQDLNPQGEVVLEGRTMDVELEDPRTVAEALARIKTGEESDEYAKQERLDRISRMTEMEDLQAPHDHPLAPLCIEDPRDYFDFQQLKTSDDTRAGTEQLRCSLSSEKAYGSFMGSVSEIKAVGLSDPIVRPEDAVMVSTVKDAMSKFYPQLEALDAAFQYYEADLQKRSAKSGDKPNRYVQE
nr:putative rna polymerase ii transcription factor b subunit 1-1 [Quercus suber]